MINIVFYTFAALHLVAVFFILFTKNILYAALGLLVALLSLAGIYIFAQADFVAIAQIFIYVGGVLVLIMFGIMLTNRDANVRNLISNQKNIFLGYTAGLLLLGILLKTILKSSVIAQNSTIIIPTSSTQMIGKALMTDFLLPFEVVAILLMVALIGAVIIAYRKIEE